MPKRTTQNISCEKCFARPFCESLDNQHNQALHALLNTPKEHKTLQAKEYLFHAHDPFSNFYIVKQGAFKKFSLSSDGREQINAFFLPGEFIGMDSVGYDEYPFSAVALEDDSIACEIPAEKFLPFITGNPEMQLRLMKTTSEQFHHADAVPRNAHAKEKIAAFLLNISERSHVHCQKNCDRISLPMSRQEIGNYLGLTIETISRIFTELKNESILVVHGKEVIITNFQKLTKIADF